MTAVEWLEKEFVKLEHSIGVYSKMYELIEKAKEMEKQQIIDAVYHNCSSMTHYDLPCGEQYYNNYIGTDCPQEQFGISDQFRL